MTPVQNKRVFRTDINGLRAYAVIAVVLFHFKVPGFGGGYAGVDVFFVISGFLMTGIIMRGLESQNGAGFNLFQFYMARARRIIPALFFLCLVMLALGWFLIAPDDYNQLAREADRALLFISNIYYYKKSGYFDTDATERILLHTWSLSVEWQFYILYPLVLMAIAKVSRRLVLPAILGILLISFIWSVITSHSNPSYAFYMLSSRAWEMLIGGLVFFAGRHEASQALRNKLYYPGLAAILLAIFVYSPETRWPGYAALLPALGTAAVILANQNRLPTNNLLFQRAGDWSYSIYLWHWPLAVALVLAGHSHFGLLAVAMIALSIFLGWLSYRFIENPLRIHLTALKNTQSLALTLIAIGLLLWPASIIRSNKGFAERLPEEIHAIFQAERDVDRESGKCHEQREKTGTDCSYGAGPTGVIIMGDSHAMSLMAAFRDHYQTRKQSVLDWSLSACPTIEGMQTQSGKAFSCPQFNNRNFAQLKEFPGIPVVVINRFSAHLLGGNEADYPQRPAVYLEQPASRFDSQYAESIYQGYKQSLCKLAASNNPVYVFRPTPELKQHVPKTMGRARLYKKQELRIHVELEELQERNQLANQLIDELVAECDITALDPIPLLCPSGGCYGDLAGTPLYFDDDHLNNLGASQLLPLIRQVSDKQPAE